MPRRELSGVIVSAKNSKTLIIKVERKFKHPTYGKIVTVSKRYVAHYDVGDYVEGQVVKILESRPISKTKKWKVI